MNTYLNKPTIWIMSIKLLKFILLYVVSNISDYKSRSYPVSTDRSTLSNTYFTKITISLLVTTTQQFRFIYTNVPLNFYSSLKTVTSQS